MDLTLQDNRFDERFYTELASAARSVEVRASGHSVRRLHLDHLCHNDILQHGFTVEMLFPNLEHLYFTSSQTVTPDIVGSFGHCGLKELSFATENRQGNTKEDEECHVPLVGDPSSLEQVFLNLFPLLTNLAFNNLVIGNNRCEIILSSLKQHQHLKNLSIIHCYTDDELDSIVSAINVGNRMKVNIQHDQAQKHLKCMKMSSSLADALCHRTSIQELILTYATIFSKDWFSDESQSTVDSKVGASGHSVCKLHINHRFLNDILEHGFTVETLFPNLEHLRFTTLQTVSPNIVGSLAHSGLKELSFETEELDDYDSFQGDSLEDEEYHVPLVGDPSSLEQVFLKSFPLLTNLSFKELVIGNNRCKIILSSLKQHHHLKNLCVIHCYTDEDLDPIVSAINMENRMKVNIQHDQAQKQLKCIRMSSSLADALCNRTSIQELSLMEKTIFSNAWCLEENERKIDSKCVQKSTLP
eukprot:XP_011682277.1 PREDICTED: uncharacterized protein LOC105446759 [Strongylocentrotus purpuratus]